VSRARGPAPHLPLVANVDWCLVTHVIPETPADPRTRMAQPTQNPESPAGSVGPPLVRLAVPLSDTAGAVPKSRPVPARPVAGLTLAGLEPAAVRQNPVDVSLL